MLRIVVPKSVNPDREVFVDPKDILLLHSSCKYNEVYTKDACYLVSLSIDAIMALPGCDLIKISKSAAVSHTVIDTYCAIENYRLRIQLKPDFIYKEDLEVTRRRRPEVLVAFKEKGI